jgi:hypothetical protein
LRKIAQHAASQRIDLLGEQTHVIASREQTLEKLSGIRIAALQARQFAATFTPKISTPGSIRLPRLESADG